MVYCRFYLTTLGTEFNLLSRPRAVRPTGHIEYKMRLDHDHGDVSGKTHQFQERAHAAQAGEPRSVQHRYIHIGKDGKDCAYFSLDHHPLLLVWRLYWYGKPLGFRGPGLHRLLVSFKRLFNISKELFYYRRHPPSFRDLLILPVYGHVGLQVQHGYKVFDLRRQMVSKYFTPDFELARVRREISSVRRVGAHDFAPTVHRWNVKERWYEEDYINTYCTPRPDWTTFLRTFHESLPPLVARIIAAFPLQEVRTLVHAEELSRQIQDTLHLDEHLDAVKLNQIRSFIKDTMDCLRLADERLVYLGWSHGDYKSKHVHPRTHGNILIDWEWAGYRSVLYDLYDAFFKSYRRFRLHPIRGCELPAVSVVVAQAICQLQLYLERSVSADGIPLMISLDTTQVYRRFYYIERICILLGREEITDRRLDRVLQYITAFTSYEAHLLDDTSCHIGHVGNQSPSDHKR